MGRGRISSPPPANLEALRMAGKQSHQGISRHACVHLAPPPGTWEALCMAAAAHVHLAHHRAALEAARIAVTAPAHSAPPPADLEAVCIAVLQAHQDETRHAQVQHVQWGHLPVPHGTAHPRSPLQRSLRKRLQSSSESFSLACRRSGKRSFARTEISVVPL